jgi:predicted  nucleic acid-binding Zn-ribbon protein
MPATAENLRELHALHQRAKALRDLMNSGPKTLAARQAVLASRQATLEQARKSLKDEKAHVKNREIQLQSHQGKSDDLRIKLNAVKKQTEYDAIRNQLAHDNLAQSKLSDEILESYIKIDEQTAALAAMEAEVKKLSDEVSALKSEIESKTGPQQTQLKELEAAITGAEEIIPIDQRDQYRRNVKQRAADALAAVEGGACSGCFVSVTAQMVNELINGGHLVFCKSCGRILYLAEEDHTMTRRGAGQGG